MWNNANKGKKTAKVKCEITRKKAKKRESQIRNNANKGEKTRKSNAKKKTRIKAKKRES